jgi:hypothetical protein
MTKSRLESIKNRWMPEDGFGIGHPIHTDELENDIRYLVQELKESQDLLKLLYNRLGGSPDDDFKLWEKTKEYCFKKKLVEYEK